MVQTLNFINLSSQQAPNDVDWAGLVNSGVQGVLIRLGHGIIRDPCASGHIAKAKQYGLYWHGYHTYEGVVNEPQFTIKNATELGLSTSQYYFVDLTKSSDPFNDYYALHATWLSQGYSTGLLISNDDYLSKFTDSEVTASGTLRWLISDTEPANYDVWQYSSEGTVGTSSAKVGLSFAKTDKLKYNLNTTLTGADISKDPYNPQAPVGGAYIGWGYDTTGLGGGKTIGYSTNGKNFYALIGPDGLIVRKSDGNRIYGTIADQIDSAISANVIPAESAANSAYSMASQAVEQANVTKQAQAATDQAITEAKQGANDAMSRAMSAWDVATGAKEAVTDFDPLIKSAQSDASKALAQIADTANALSDAKTAFGSGVAEAKELAITAQTTANSAVESAGENAKELASQANALSDTKKAIDSDVASAKGLANAAQATADNAIKSASSVANDLSVVASQAKANANGITKVTSDVGLLQTTVADNSGNISTIQETAKQIQQSVSDNAGNITVAKQTADSAVAVASDAKSNATVAVQTASGASVTAKNAQGDATTAMTTANSAVIQASDAKSNATVAVQTASEASLTAANAKGDASIAKQTASDASVQIKNAQGDISKLQTRAGAIETSVANNSGAIADVQATANQLKASVSDNAGNITIAKQTADSAITVASDAKSNATVASQTASQASITAQNASGQAASAVITANGAMTTASDAKSDATVAIQTASGASLTATNAQGDASIAKQTASEAKVQASNAESDFAQLSVRANKIETNVANNSGAIASVQQTANRLTATVAKLNARDGTNLLQGTSATDNEGPCDFSGIAVTAGDNYTFSGVMSSPSTSGVIAPYIWFFDSSGTKLGEFAKNSNVPVTSGTKFAITGVAPVNAATAHVFLAKSDTSITLNYRLLKFEHGSQATPWTPAPTDASVAYNSLKVTVDQTSNIINDPKTGLNATYQTATGNATTISNVKSDVYQLETTATGLTSRVGNLESKTNTQETEIQQNKNAITLKADQTDVNTLKGNVTSLQAEVTTQANEITTKVTQSDVTGMLTGYATQDYTQSLVTQKAGEISESIVKLDQTVKQGAENNVQLVRKSDFEDGDKGGWDAQTVVATDPPAELGQSGMKVLQTNVRDDYEEGIWYSVKPGENFDVDFWCKPSTACSSKLGLLFTDKDYNNNWAWAGIATDQSGQWKHYTGTITAPANVSFAKPWFLMNKDSSNTTGTALLAKPSIRRQNATTVAAIQQISTSIDGLQSNVTNLKNDTSSQITQLSNLIATKVSSDDFNNLSKNIELQTLDSADINNMKTNGHYFVHNLANTPIQGWVYVDVVGNGNDRIRQDVYQDLGNQHCYRRWYNSSWMDWSQGATESEITQLSDDINLRVKSADLISQINLQAGTALIQSNKLVLDAGTTVFTGDAFIPSAAISSISADKIMLGSTSLYNSDGTLNLVNTNDGTTSKITVTQGSVNFDGTNKTASVIHFASDNNTNAFTVNPTGATVTPTLFFERFDQTVGHWLGFTRNEVENEGVTFHTWDDDGQRFFVSCHARFDKNLSTLGTFSQGSWDGTTAKPEAGVLTIKSGNTIWSGSDFLAIGSNVTNSYTGVWAKAFVQQSTLSSKTNIETVDPKDALDLVNKTDIRSYQYKSDVEQGKTKRYTSLIIDDVNDVSQYYAPDEFTSEERNGRDDGSAVGYLFLAVKELTRRIKTLEDKLHG